VTSILQLLLLLLGLAATANQVLDERGQPKGHLGLGRVRLAVDLDLGLTGAPFVFGDVGEDGGQMASAASPRLLCYI